MRPIQLLAFALMGAACHKDDVDIASLDTNTFDPDHSTNELFTVQAITTVDTYQGVLFDQNIQVQAHPEHFPQQVAYQIWMVELSPHPDTMRYGSQGHANGAFTLENHQVTLGQEYCYRIELHVGPELVRSEERCSTAEL